MIPTKMSPQEAAEWVKKEDHITLVFEEGFEEFSETAKEFREEIYAPAVWEEKGLWASEFRHETHLKDSRWASANEFERGAIERILLAGEWSYLILHDQPHPDPNCHVVVYNSMAPATSEALV